MLKFLKSSGNHLKVGIGYGVFTAAYLTLFDFLRFLFSPYLSNSPSCVRASYLQLELTSNFIIFTAIGFLTAILFSVLLPGFHRPTSRVRLVHLIPQFLILQYLQLTLLVEINGFSDTAEVRTWLAMGGVFLAGSFYMFSLDYLLRRLYSRSRNLVRMSVVTFVLCLVVLLALLASDKNSKAANPAGATNRLNLLLLTIDTLRFDHLSYNGYYRNTSPTIDSLSQEATVFRNAYTPLPRTAPALASLLTGKYPHRHGIRSNWYHILADTNFTLAEILSQHGYRTAAFVHNPSLSPARKLSRGFKDYAEIYELGRQLQRIPALCLIGEFGLSRYRRYLLDWNARLDTDLALRWLKANSRSSFFLWVHYLEPHTPYSPPPQYVDRYGRGYSGKYRWGFSFSLEEQKENTFGCKLPRKDIQRAIDLYDSEIKYVDDQIGRLMEYLRESGLDENTIIIFTSDHGEGLGEHNYFFEHGDLLYQHNSKVPLFIILPGSEVRAQIDAPVSINDVFPTALELLGIGNEAEIDGISLLPYISGKDSRSQRLLFGETGVCYYPEKNDRILIKVVHDAFANMSPEEWFGSYDSLYVASKQRMVLSWPWKLIYIPDGGAGVYELYNLKADPGELYNLIGTEPLLEERLRKEVLAWAEAGEKLYFPVGVSLEEEVREALKALGYVR